MEGLPKESCACDCPQLSNSKLELKLSASTTCSVYSEYLRFYFSLTDLILHSAFDPKLLKTIENVVRSKQNLVHFKLFNLVSASYAFIGVLFALPERERAFSNLAQRLQWNQLVGIKALLSVRSRFNTF